MAIHSRKNHYQGVNAHLQSYFQNKGGWKSFHGRFINFLFTDLDTRLPSSYTVDMEQSLQISEFHPDTGERIKRPEPDITIYSTETTSLQNPGLSSSLATLDIPVIETLEQDEDLYLTALMIYKMEDEEALGTPVTRIEILSPTNKPPGDGYIQYVEKRNVALKSGLCLVEIDFLHETNSPIKGVPGYRRRQPGAFPYYIAVSNPHPSLEEGRTRIYGFHVGTKIPAVDIPLADEDNINVDFNRIYNETCESAGAYARRVDYEQLPKNFDSYSDFDKAQILRVMERVKAKKSD